MTTQLETLAQVALGFSPQVSLSPPCSVLLEIGASQRLFGSVQRIAELVLPQAQSALAEDGLAVSAAIAPTPLAAEVLAAASRALNNEENGKEEDGCILITSKAALQSVLDECPVSLLWDSKLCGRLEAVGVLDFGACRALPPAGVRKRYGAKAARDLARLYGDRGDPRPTYLPPPSFQRFIELDAECPDSTLLEPVCGQLFAALSAELTARDRSVIQLRLRLTHGTHPATEIVIGQRQPGRQAEHWRALLHEHFQRTPLPAPVRGIELSASDFIDPCTGQLHFWQTADAGQRETLMEKLAARLGPSALRTLHSVATHRPEWAVQRHTLDDAATVAAKPSPASRGFFWQPAANTRPLWLLHQPRALPPSQLRDISPPERVESGWWEDDCTRDYHRARSPEGQRLWVFRDHRDPQRWFLHGLFG